MNDAVQPVAGSLSAIVIRACRTEGCPYFGTTECQYHTRTQDLGVVATFENRKESNDAK